MHTKTWYEFISEYTSSGIKVILLNEIINLTQKDVCYLLRDVYEIARTNSRLERIPFGILGHSFEVPYAEWMKFEKDLLNAVIYGGWTVGCCGPANGMLEAIRSIQKQKK
jgi:hypothetical protein